MKTLGQLEQQTEKPPEVAIVYQELLQFDSCGLVALRALFSDMSLSPFG